MRLSYLEIANWHLKFAPMGTRKLQKSTSIGVVATAQIEQTILVIRGHRVLLDQDLARLYRVQTKALTRAVRRNLDRFPPDFMFRLTKAEFDDLRRHLGASSSWGGRRYPPYAFTEHGAVMLAAVLNSPIAVQASIQVVRAFVRLRQLVMSNNTFRRKLTALERKLQDHDEKFSVVFEAIRQLMEEPDDAPAKPRIGYQTEADALD
jgi:hypothetical protein